MQYTVFFLLLFLLAAPSHTWAASSPRPDVQQLAGKLWRVMDITREYTPQFRAHVILEAPDNQRLTLIFRDEAAQSLVRNDVIALEVKSDLPPDIPDAELGDFLIPTRVRLGKTRWWKERIKEEGKDIERGLKLFLEQHLGEETEI